MGRRKHNLSNSVVADDITVIIAEKLFGTITWKYNVMSHKKLNNIDNNDQRNA